MMDTRTHRRVSRNRKKNSIPLSNLRTAEVVKTLVDHPRRLEELVHMLEDKDRSVRDRAAAILARLSESHPRRLLRILERILDALSDDSAYVRWHLVYTLGRIGSRFPARSQRFLAELSGRLEDDNRIVRLLAARSLSRVVARWPLMVREFFECSKREIPAALAQILHRSSLSSKRLQSR